jgi:thiol:disulfide interchange protein DsbD
MAYSPIFVPLMYPELQNLRATRNTFEPNLNVADMRFYLLLLAGLFSLSLSAQIYNPVKWSVSLTPAGDGQYTFLAKATIDEGWWVYSQYLENEDGPIATTVNFDAGDHYKLVGKNKESDNAKKIYDKVFEMEVTKFSKSYTIEQKIKITDPSKPLTGYINFMTCNDERCLPPTDKEFELFATGGSTGAVSPGTGKENKKTETVNSGNTEVAVGDIEKKNPADNASVNPADSSANAADSTLLSTTEVSAGPAGPKFDANGNIDQSIPSIKSTFSEPISQCGEHKAENKSNLLWMFIFGMINGFVALLTPCVFPMIPLTVSFFTKDSKRKGWENGLIYGLSIMGIYVALGLLITILFGAGSLNELSTNPIANTIFFLIFVFFAFSFFGFYEITLPSSWSNKSDALADKGGLIGIFFMAATLAIVSFSCTGPLIGTALVEASSAGFLGPLIVMFGFSLALAIPFSLFAAFPSWLNSLPKSGNWMNSVKVILGFAELALAFKFLSIADMTAHWGFLRYELFMVLWVLTAIGMAAYLFGWIKFPHDSPNRRISPLSGLFGILFAALGIYLATGLFGSEKTGTYNSLSLMSGLAPPAHYNFFKPLEEVPQEINGQFASLSKCANNFNCFHDYYEGLSYAREVNKPILLDFTGYGCVNCRKTEEHIWSNDAIREKINNDFVLVSLYVDDKMSIEPRMRSAITEQPIRTVGQKWTDFQVVNFNQNSQPLYVILSPNEKVLTTPRGYDPDVKAYENFLDCGLTTFKEMSAPVIGSSE